MQKSTLKILSLTLLVSSANQAFGANLVLPTILLGGIFSPGIDTGTKINTGTGTLPITENNTVSPIVLIAAADELNQYYQTKLEPTDTTPKATAKKVKPVFTSLPVKNSYFTKHVKEPKTRTNARDYHSYKTY